MKSNGAVICFQKFTLADTVGQIANIPKSPVCLGYFGRVEVKEVNTFKEYVRIASRHGANQACSRKQLMLYRLDSSLDNDVSVASDVYRENGGIPFWHSENETFGLCCCTAVNITPNTTDKKLSIKEAATQIHSALAQAKKNTNANYRFAVTGLLDAEDICIIILSNRYDEISSAVGSVLSLTFPGSSQCIVDNSHSILMMDTTGTTYVEKAGWEGVYADIQFSVKSEAGKAYLARVVEKLKDKAPENIKEQVFVHGQTGEYDALIRCPAELLDSEMYGDSGLISYTNNDYRNAVYQSETIVYPFGGESNKPLTRLPLPEDQDLYDLSKKVEAAVKEIKLCFLGNSETEDNDFDYIELALYRLLKDYRRMSAYPYNSDLRKDLAVQFVASVNAIVEAARKCQRCDLSDSISSFNKEFDEIVNALSQSMQAASQFDRLNFDEHAHYLQNIGSYHKVLRCYYGIIKDILKLLYTIERKENSEQALLVPLLSFGLTPIIISNKYDSKYDYNGRTVDARLISIKLPYQAIANPPKYLGILVHELFHYAAPYDREDRNRILVTFLAKTALMEYVRVLADGLKLGYAKHYGFEFYKRRKEDVDAMAKCWSEEILKNDFIRLGQSDELSDELPKYFNLTHDPSSTAYKTYYNLWINLRKQLADNLSECSHEERKVFALDIEDDDDTALITKAFERRINALTPTALESFYKLLSDSFYALGELPPDLFDVGKSTNRKLALFGIKTIGDLARADEEVLNSHLGKMGSILWSFANGYDDSPVKLENTYAPIKSVGNSTTTPKDLVCDEDVKIVLYILAESVAARLRENGFRCRVIEISVRDNELFSFTRQKKIDHATNITGEIAAYAYQIFKENYNWSKPIRSVGVRGADLVTDNYWEQIDLFSSVEKREKQMKMDSAVDEIRRRFGFYSIQRGLMYRDRILSAVNAKEEHTVHPHGYFG